MAVTTSAVAMTPVTENAAKHTFTLLVRLLLNVDLQWTYCFTTINVSIG